MAVTNIQKEEVCDKYKVYLMIIYELGNKVMLSKQLFELAVALDLVEYKIDYWKILDELRTHNVIKTEQFTVFNKKTQHQVIILCKYAIRYLEGKDKSSDVASVPKSNSNERIILSIFKTTFILDKVIPSLKKKEKFITWKAIKDYLEYYKSNILYNKNQGLLYLQEFTKGFPKSALIQSSIQADIENLLELQCEHKVAFMKGSLCSTGKGSGKIHSTSKEPLQDAIDTYKQSKINISELINSPKDKKLYSCNFNSMFNAFIYVDKIGKDSDGIKVIILMFDIYNSSNIYKLAQNIAAVYFMLRRYFNCKFRLTVKVVSFDPVGKKRLKEEAEKKTQNKISKELNNNGKLLKYLLLNNLTFLEAENIEVFFTNYDITNKYLDGIKYLNILKAQ